MKNRFLKTTLVLLVTLVFLAPEGRAQNYDEIISFGTDGAEFNIMGFGDISYISRDGNNNDGFVIGQGFAHLSAYLGGSLSGFSEISQMDESQYRQYWIAKMFRAEVPRGPKIVFSTGMTLDLVVAIPGSISFMRADQVSENVKILRVDGKLPSEEGYPLM